jgi:hypothetical protein
VTLNEVSDAGSNYLRGMRMEMMRRRGLAAYLASRKYFVNAGCMAEHNDDKMNFAETVPKVAVEAESLDYYTNACYNVSYIIAVDSEKRMDLKKIKNEIK